MGHAGIVQAPRRLGLAVVLLWFSIGGIAHFALTETGIRIVPPWAPWPRAAVRAWR